MRPSSRNIGVLLVCAIAIGTVSGAVASPGTAVARVGERASLRLDAADFTDPMDNPWFPLTPGTVTRLRGRDEDGRYVERVRVTGHTRTVVGVPARAVRDVLRRADGSLAEATTDWYAADNAGNVWYLGERTATYDRQGHVDSREGSWLAGRDGARAGLIMPARPRPTDAFRQEYYPGHAEDQAWIVAFQRVARVPAGRFRHVLRVYEWSRLEPSVVSVKLYARGVGIIAERDVAGGQETFSLVSVQAR
jgi:hypothetical protein